MRAILYQKLALDIARLATNADMENTAVLMSLIYLKGKSLQIVGNVFERSIKRSTLLSIYRGLRKFSFSSIFNSTLKLGAKRWNKAKAMDGTSCVRFFFAFISVFILVSKEKREKNWKQPLPRPPLIGQAVVCMTIICCGDQQRELLPKMTYFI